MADVIQNVVDAGQQKRGRGRPRKYPVNSRKPSVGKGRRCKMHAEWSNGMVEWMLLSREAQHQFIAEHTVKRGRGRPRKVGALTRDEGVLTEELIDDFQQYAKRRNLTTPPPAPKKRGHMPISQGDLFPRKLDMDVEDKQENYEPVSPPKMQLMQQQTTPPPAPKKQKPVTTGGAGDDLIAQLVAQANVQNQQMEYPFTPPSPGAVEEHLDELQLAEGDKQVLQKDPLNAAEEESTDQSEPTTPTHQPTQAVKPDAPKKAKKPRKPKMADEEKEAAKLAKQQEREVKKAAAKAEKELAKAKAKAEKDRAKWKRQNKDLCRIFREAGVHLDFNLTQTPGTTAGIADMIAEKISDIKNGSMESYVFPSSLTTMDRHMVHKAAAVAGLEHYSSHPFGGDRVIRIGLYHH